MENRFYLYYINAWNFYVNNTLTIQPGVIVKFHATKGPELLLGSGGTIMAKGTSSQPIIFTSYKDDIHGGDTNGNGTGTTPASADWDYISIEGNNGSVFEHCQFLYGGDSTFGTLKLSGSRTTVKNCLFAHNVGGKSGCCYYGALNASDAKAGTIIENNTFYDNILPLTVDVSFSLDDSNVFHNPTNASEANQYNGVFVEADNHIGTAISWQETEVAFVINNNDLWVNSGASLTLADNVVIKFTEGSSLLYQGNNINNYDGTGVVFTSFKDDTKKGDTNGDVNASSPGNKDWLGIYNNHVNVGGYETWANIFYD
jgi:hypothetical protein